MSEMSGTRTLQTPYPKEKNPFHEDVAKPKNRIKRTFSKLQESLRRSFRKKPEPQPKYGLDYRHVEQPVRRAVADEEFVLRTKIPDRYAAAHDVTTASLSIDPGASAMQSSTMHRHTVAAATVTSTSPVPPPRTSSIRRRNRLNSTSSACSRNPFDDDVTPLFADHTVPFSSSRHTLNVQCTNIHQHENIYAYGSQESITTIGHTRRKKRDAPPPPPPPNHTTNQQHDTEITMTVASNEDVVASEAQQIHLDIALMTEQLIQGDVACDDLGSTNEQPVQCANSSQAVDHVHCDTEHSEPPAGVDNVISAESVHDHNNSNIIPKEDKHILIEPIQLDVLTMAVADDSIYSPAEYVSSETIVLKRTSSKVSPPTELTTFLPVQKQHSTNADVDTSDVEIVPVKNTSFIQRRKAHFEANIVRDSEIDINVRKIGSENRVANTNVLTDVVAVDMNSNELEYGMPPIVNRQPLKYDDEHIKYIDEDRYDILDHPVHTE